MDSKGYLSLNSWLQKADRNYIEGRLLWFNLCVDGASNLLWLALEQIIKILLLQKNIDSFSKQCGDLDELYVVLEKEAKKIGHSVNQLLSSIDAEYEGLNVNTFKDVLEKTNEYFYRRYVVKNGSSISLLMINDIDNLYFLLRSNILSDVGVSVIDEICIQKKNEWKHPIDAFVFAYKDNKYFKPRKHTEIVYSSFDGSGKLYVENGT